MSADALRERVDEASEVLSALANANRLMILCHLLEGELSVTALQGKVDLAQSALSQHLAKLRVLKLVSTRREAQTIFYSVESDKVKAILSLIKSLYCPPDSTGGSMVC
jgi:ArsR family transcriptional regulator, virulence genes transcriptional regulator